MLTREEREAAADAADIKYARWMRSIITSETIREDHRHTENSRWGLCRLFVIGPKPDQRENDNAGAQSHNVRHPQASVFPGRPGKKYYYGKDGDHQRQECFLSNHCQTTLRELRGLEPLQSRPPLLALRAKRRPVLAGP